MSESKKPGRVEAHYQVHGLDRLLYPAAPEWDGFEMLEMTESSISFRLWFDGAMDAKDVEEQIARLDVAARSFWLALMRQRVRLLFFTQSRVYRPEFPSDRAVSLVDQAVCSDSVVTDVKLAPPPKDLPQIPLEAERLILTFAEVGMFSGYVEEQLRREYLLIEELWPEFCDQLKGEAALKGELNMVRDFVSHPHCHKQDVVNFISRELPSALHAGPNGRRVVRFLRNEEHRNFVGRHEPKALELAKRLLAIKLASLSAG